MILTADQTAFHKMRIDRMLRDKTKGTRDRNLAIWSQILEFETLAGTSFMASIDGTVYVFWGVTRQIMALSSAKRAEHVYAYLNTMYGLVASEPIMRFVIDSLISYAMTNAPRMELRRFASFNTVEKVTYLTNRDGRMWRIDGGTPELIDNGTEDVFFADDDSGTYVDADVGPHGILLDRLTDINFAEVGLGGITPEQQRRAYTVWMFALAFPDFMPTKPMLIVEGPPGSGKSAAVQLLQIALLGQSKPLIISKNKGDDFGVQLLRSPIAVLDNVDSYIDWIPDTVCAYATAGTWTKRKLFSDAEEVIIKPHAFIAVASKNPTSFRREDTADRCVVLRLERLASFGRFEKLAGDTLAARPQLFGEYIFYVNEIVEYMRVHGVDIEREEKSRMADFAAFGRAVSAVLHWPANAIDELMAALVHERDAFIREEDPLSDLLLAWLKMPGKIGREVSPSELFDELRTIAENRKIDFYKSSRTLVQKLRSPHIQNEFILDEILKEGRKTFRFWRKTDARLNVVPGDGLPSNGGAASGQIVLEIVKD